MVAEGGDSVIRRCPLGSYLHPQDVRISLHRPRRPARANSSNHLLTKGAVTAVCICTTVTDGLESSNHSHLTFANKQSVRNVEMNWNDWGFRPPLCTYRLIWARRTSWRWWDEWDDTVLQTQDSKFEPWRFEAEHITSLLCKFPAILSLYEWAGKKHFVSFTIWRPQWGLNQRSPTFQSGSFNHEKSCQI